MKLGERLRRNGLGKRPTRVYVSDLFAFEGGLNLVDPPLVVKPGHLIGAKNYEPGVRGGYSRVDGYERFDGRPSPTRADYWTLEVTGVVGTPFVVGDILRQYEPGETVFDNTTQIGNGIIASINNMGSGTFVIGVVETTDTDEFVDGFEQDGDVYTADPADPQPGTLRGTSTFAFRNGATTDEVNEQVAFDKTEYYRDEIEAVGGAACAGPVKGVAVFKDRVVAFRGNAAGTATLMFETNQNTYDGWQAVNLGHKIRFDTGGTTAITVGQTIEGGTSGATAVVSRIVYDGGDVGASTATGFIIVQTITGTFSVGEDIEVSATKKAEVVSVTAQSLPVIPEGKRMRFRVHNFAGAGDNTCLYGVNGVANAFEYDSDGTFVLIETGMVNDAPTHVFVLNNHLILTFPGGSIQNSSYGKPTEFDPVLGADERTIGGDVTDGIEETDRTLILATRNRTYVMYGDDAATFVVKEFTRGTGMLPDTANKLGHTIFLDDHGFTTLKAAQDFGNFSTNSISDKILPTIQTVLKARGIAGSVISRRKNLYRLFFDNGSALVIATRPGGKFSGWMQIAFPIEPTCFDSGELEFPVGIIPEQTQNPGPIFPERIFFGAEDGFVYEMDIGYSFDGENIEHFMRTVYHHSHSPEIFKHYRKATIDVDVQGKCTLFCTVDFNYGNRTGQQGIEAEFAGGGGLWDIANWDEFKWSGSVFDQLVLKIEGDGYNIGMFFYGNSNREASHTLYNTTYHYSRRKINRGMQGD